MKRVLSVFFHVPGALFFLGSGRVLGIKKVNKTSPSLHNKQVEATILSFNGANKHTRENDTKTKPLTL